MRLQMSIYFVAQSMPTLKLSDCLANIQNATASIRAN